MIRKPKIGKKKANVEPKGKAVRPPNQRCEMCGHWSPATEYGIDEKSGYCDHWQKLTARDFWCDEFVDRSKYQAIQEQLAEENEDYLEEDTG